MTLVKMTGTSNRSAFLDGARALSALCVLCGHAFPLVFVPYREIGAFSIFWKLFYMLFSLGHQAVIVFFVLSGFLIGREVYDGIVRGNWTLAEYLIKRISRLYVVLIPALCMTLLLDHIGMSIFDGHLYLGQMNNVYFSTPSLEDADKIYLPATFLANLFFLQTVLTPRFGSNTPLWSLANEFWYYMLFAIGLLAANAGYSRFLRVFAVLIGLLIITSFPVWLTAYGLIWLIGAGTAVISRKVCLAKPYNRYSVMLAVAVFLASIALSRGLGKISHIPDSVMGLSFATLILLFLEVQIPIGWLSKVLHFLSEISFTIYLFHFPFICLLATVFLHENQIYPCLHGVGLWLSLIFSALGYSTLFYFLFEIHTRRIQKFLLRTYSSHRVIKL